VTETRVGTFFSETKHNDERNINHKIGGEGINNHVVKDISSDRTVQIEDVTSKRRIKSDSGECPRRQEAGVRVWLMVLFRSTKNTRAYFHRCLIEFYLLKQSIKEDGLHIPIIINKQGIILDGHLVEDIILTEKLLTVNSNCTKYTGSLMRNKIKFDSVRGYFGSEVDLLCLIKILSKRAQNQSRSGCFVIADMGSFYLIRMVNELMKYEASLPLKFDTYENGFIKGKAFCTYHQKDFDSLTEDQKQLLFEHHYRNFIVSE
jgi:hypothetical protein